MTSSLGSFTLGQLVPSLWPTLTSIVTCLHYVHVGCYMCFINALITAQGPIGGRPTSTPHLAPNLALAVLVHSHWCIYVATLLSLPLLFPSNPPPSSHVNTTKWCYTSPPLHTHTYIHTQTFTGTLHCSLTPPAGHLTTLSLLHSQLPHSGITVLTHSAITALSLAVYATCVL